MRDYCNVVGDNKCKAPPQLDRTAQTECWRCGLAVCTSCSQIVTVTWYGEKIRVRTCDDCMPVWVKDGEAKVVRKRYKHADQNISLAQAKALL